MDFNGSLGLHDFKRDIVLQVVDEPAALGRLVLLEARGIDGLGKLIDCEFEVDRLTSVHFACFLKMESPVCEELWKASTRPRKFSGERP